MSQFDTHFTRQTPVDSPDDTALSESANQAFLVRPGGLRPLGTRAGLVAKEPWALSLARAPSAPRVSRTWRPPSWTASRRASPSSPSCALPGASTAAPGPPSGAAGTGLQLFWLWLCCQPGCPGHLLTSLSLCFSVSCGDTLQQGCLLGT